MVENAQNLGQVVLDGGRRSLDVIARDRQAARTDLIGRPEQSSLALALRAGAD